MLYVPLILQEATGIVTNPPVSSLPPIVKEITLWEMIEDAGWFIIIPMAILSIVMVYISIERYMAIQKATKGEQLFMRKIREYISEGKIDSARHLCQSTDNPYARMVEKGISKIGKPLKDIETAIENVGKIEIYQLEKGISLLATISGVAPMMAFLGTVLGMIRTFNELRQSGQVQIEQLSGGIMMAMVATVIGLVIGIISYIMYNTLVAKVQKVISKMETTSIDFLDLLDEPGK